MSTHAATSEPMSLAELQRQMAAAVMAPLTPNEDMCAQDAEGRPMAEIAASFIAANSRLAPFERLEIYNRQYWYRVLDALAEDFPALRAVVGGRAFHQLSIDYLTVHPSTSFSLRNLGWKLVEWLAAHAQHTGRRHRLALDVARIEWAFIEAFDNAERTPLTLDKIATLDGNSQLGLQPHLRLLSLDYAADDLVLALHKRQKRGTSEAGVKHEDDAEQDQGDESPAKLPRLRRRATWVAAHRLENAVYYRRLEREEFLTLSAIHDGQPLGEALDAGFRGSTVPEAGRPPLVRAWFGHWAELGWICAPELESLLEK
jgi:hypothetical protein